jgi:class 3 adenylate cyclase/HAMP domain-containing protein
VSGQARASIGRRLIAASGLLVLAVVGVMVWIWATSARDLVRDATRRRAVSFTSLFSTTYMNELDDEDWTQIENNLGLATRRDETFVYAFVYDARRHDKIMASTVEELRGQFVPDVVPHDLARDGDGAIETSLLRDVDFANVRRGSRGDRVIDVSVPIRLSSGITIGRLQAGVSLVRASQAERSAITKALGVGAVALAAGLLGAFLLGRNVARRIARLQASANEIAAGDLGRRAVVGKPPDELDSLAEAFNRMTDALKKSFGQLERTVASFVRFVPEEFLHVIADRGIENIEVGRGEARTVSILFSDIRGYTSLSERLSANEIFRDLNEYLEAMGQAIDREGGFVDKYIGDAIMAIFDAQTTDGVLRAALGMRAALTELNALRTKEGKVPLETGIGIHRGLVVMGTVGSATRINCTVIGDAVNLASRVEGLCKTYGVPILVTDAVMSALADRSKFDVDLADAAATVKGKNIPVRLYALKVMGPPVAAPEALASADRT